MRYRSYNYIVLLSGIAIIAFVIFYLIRQMVLIPSFSALEKEEAIKNINRAQDAITREIKALENTVKDWAIWDDTYQFVQGGDLSYVRKHLQWSHMKGNLGIHFILIADKQGKIIWGGAQEPDQDGVLELNIFSGNHFDPKNFFNRNDVYENGAHGLWSSEHGVMIISAHPTLPSSAEGLSNGLLVMGRLLNDDFISALGDQANIELQARFLRPGSLQAEEQNQMNQLIKLGTLIDDSDPNTLWGHCVLRDVSDHPALKISLKIPRVIMARAKIASRTTGVVIAMSAFVIALIGCVLLYRSEQLKRELILRSETQQSLKQNEKFLNTIVENIPDMIFVKDAKELRFIRFNKAGEELLGYSREEMIGKNDYDLFSKQEADLFTEKDRQAIDKGILLDIPEESMQTQYRGRRLLHTKKIPLFNENGQASYLLGISEDITDYKQLEEQLQQTQKMEAIGTLAGGIAHDFNNILSAILGYSELILAGLPSDDSIRKKVEAIHRAGERARDLVSQILAYSRKDENIKLPVEMHLLIKDSLKLLRPAIPKTIDIQTHIISECRILGDPARVHQVIMNLCTNAYQSMLETGGTLTISLSNINVEAEGALEINIPAGSYAKLVISDTGVGIPPENIDRIFDPYFTTKEKGKGTGLGLAAVHGIVKSHGGDILVKSKVGKGTEFEVYLPLTRARSEGVEQAESRFVSGEEQILLVDDENDILEINKEMLVKLGYSVTAVDNAQDALKLFADQPEKFDLVITDMTMPNMTGDRLAIELRKIRLSIPIILCSGFSEIMSNGRAAALGIESFLMKPISLKDLSLVTRSVIDDAKNKT